MRQTWLAKKDKKKVALRLIPNHRHKRLDAEIVGQNGEAIDFDPEEGTVARAHVRCPLCGGTVDDKTTRRLFREGKSGERLMAVVLYHPGKTGKTYRLPKEEDLKAYQATEKTLKEKRSTLFVEWGMDPVPDEPLPLMSGVFNVPIYGLTRWGDLFSSRQKFALITFADTVRRAHAEMLAQGADPEFAKAVVTYLGLAVDRVVDSNSAQCWWQSSWEKEAITFARQALQMTWDYFEQNPFAITGYNLKGFLDAQQISLAHLTRIPPVGEERP